ncbi:MAG: hypothetical protein ACPGVE_04370, partial [Flavobacteriales bacterium]
MNTKNFNFFLLLLAAVFLCTTSKAQESAPTLSHGVDGITSSKGTLDIDLITDMVNTKKEELKDEFIKQEFAKLFGNHNYALFEYSTNMLEMLLESKGKDVIKKNTLEYTANMAVVYGLTKFYVKASKGSKNEKLNAFYKIFNRHKDNPNDTIEVKVKFDINENNTYYYQCPKTSNTKLYANMVLMDMVYQILRNNENAKKLGFFQMPQPFGEAYAEEQNTYNLLHKKLKKMKRDDDSKHLKGFYDYLEKQLKFLIDNFYTIGEMHKRVKTLDGL